MTYLIVTPLEMRLQIPGRVLRLSLTVGASPCCNHFAPGAVKARVGSNLEHYE